MSIRSEIGGSPGISEFVSRSFIESIFLARKV
jgi:hypothetical protein